VCVCGCVVLCVYVCVRACGRGEGHARVSRAALAQPERIAGRPHRTLRSEGMCRGCEGARRGARRPFCARVQTTLWQSTSCVCGTGTRQPTTSLRHEIPTSAAVAARPTPNQTDSTKSAQSGHTNAAPQDLGVFPVTELEERASLGIRIGRIIILHAFLFLTVLCPFVLFPVLLTREDSYCITQNTTVIIDLYSHNCEVNIVAQTRDPKELESDHFGSSARASRLEIVVSRSAAFVSVTDSVNQVWPRFKNRILSLFRHPEIWTGNRTCSTAGANGTVWIRAEPGTGSDPYIPCTTLVRLPLGMGGNAAPCAQRSQWRVGE
jgi:hypothetical protein